MKLAIIANPWASRGRRRAFFESFRVDGDKSGVDVEITLTTGPGDAERLARERAETADVIGIVGGDGTIHEVVNGIMPNPVPVVVLPSGSGNDLASLIDCPQSPSELLDTVCGGRGARLDVFAVGDHFCANSAGLGFEGQVNRESHNVTRLRGSALYFAAVLKALSSLACPHFRITTSEGLTVENDMLVVSIGNGNRTGGAFYLTPNALPDDGLIDLCLIRRMSRLRMMSLLPLSFKGRHVQRPEVEMLRSRSLLIETDPGYPMHIDGELVDPAPARFEVTVRHRILPVLCKPSNTKYLTHPLEQLL